MNYYSTLGVKQNATTDEIKKAYRILAMKHHPDRGGDETQFKKISEAYEVLSDPDKRRMVDMGADPNQQQPNPGQRGPFEFHFGSGNFEDIFSHFGFGGQSRVRRNKDIRVRVAVDLEEVLTGKDMDAEIGVSGGKKKIVNISIPPGIENQQQIRYRGMGDTSIPNAPPGDLIVGVVILPHQHFARDGDTLICEKTVSAWDAILGSQIEIQTLDRRKLTLRVPRGTQPGTVLSCKEEGLPNVRSGKRGNLLVKIKVEIPRKLSDIQLEKIKEFKDGI